jgi:signal transduction histidine kinase
MILVLCISFFVLGTSFATISYRVIMNDKTEELQDRTVQAANFISTYVGNWNMDSLEMRAVLIFASENVDSHIILADGEGNIVACSDTIANCEHIGKVISPDIISQINKNGSYMESSTLSGIFSEKKYVTGTALPSVKNGYPGYVFLSSDAEELNEVWRSFLKIFLAAAGIVVVAAFIVSFITTKKQAKPLNEMAEAAHKFAHGDFSVRVHETARNDEIGELVYSFNRMAESLENSENARRELIANVSHELKTPMTTITGFADGVLDGTIPPEKEREYLGIISSETKRLSRLVRGMLDMSQLQSQENKELMKKTFDISEVIRLSLLSLEQKITKRGLDVDVNLPEEAVMTLGDQDAITQVVYNLIDNAAKFASPGSTIKLELWKKEEKAYVSVKNTGETISKEELPLIFDRFHKTDRSRSMDKDGVGLGLYIVKTILDSHGEDIFVTSKDGVTDFTFTLELSKENL